METVTEIISAEALLAHWQGHRTLTRRVIEAFPEKELFEFSIGGMRPFSKIVMELLGIAGPGLKEIVSGQSSPLNESFDNITTKAQLLEKWDEENAVVNEYFPQITPERFHETFNLFGMYEAPVIYSIQYFIDNEIHHRGQGYVYLRALGVEPPPFWER
ncbi:putative damage-inducible protein DinB [Arcticibacter tournemirensis]|uniref:Damage-inducible protein DinB n=1 Tax=Arcticibacter tournemirensis TaxID=699437 RepID=A0A5M9HBE0_9SPHI|nr:DinB family protein [Arcticibacter tournemirensis]KAA8483679.1 damage-inducible protein DinB [Arcticibacter tournemirensis]TQM51360.1 putative damage-inducible protein DinB [Arcticibacter tournemirensis]